MSSVDRDTISAWDSLRKRGVAALGSTGASLASGAAATLDLLGADEVAYDISGRVDLAKQRAAKLVEEAGGTQTWQYGKDSIYDKFKQGTLRPIDVGRGISDLAVSQAPQIGMSIAGAGAGSKLLSPKISKWLKKPGEAEMAGAMAGGFATSFAQETGSIYSEQEKPDALRAMQYALPAAAMESAGQLYGINKAGLGGFLAEELAPKATKSLGGIALDTLKVAGTEGLTEAGQTVLEQAGARPTGERFTESLKHTDWGEVLEAGIGGSILGGGLHGTTAPITNALQKIEEEERAAFEQEIKSLREQSDKLTGNVLSKSEDDVLTGKESVSLLEEAPTLDEAKRLSQDQNKVNAIVANSEKSMEEVAFQSGQRAAEIAAQKATLDAQIDPVFHETAQAIGKPAEEVHNTAMTIWQSGKQTANEFVQEFVRLYGVAKQYALKVWNWLKSKALEQRGSFSLEEKKPKVINDVPGLVGDTGKPVYTKEGVNILRKSGNQHFGNPFSSKGYGKVKTATVSEAVKAYEDWLEGKAHQDIEPERRKWILDQIQQGKLDNQNILYYKNIGEKSHADALAEFVAKVRQPAKQSTPQVEEVIAPTEDIASQRREDQRVADIVSPPAMTEDERLEAFERRYKAQLKEDRGYIGDEEDIDEALYDEDADDWAVEEKKPIRSDVYRERSADTTARKAREQEFAKFKEIRTKAHEVRERAAKMFGKTDKDGMKVVLAPEELKVAEQESKKEIQRIEEEIYLEMKDNKALMEDKLGAMYEKQGFVKNAKTGKIRKPTEAAPQTADEYKITSKPIAQQIWTDIVALSQQFSIADIVKFIKDQENIKSLGKLDGYPNALIELQDFASKLQDDSVGEFQYVSAEGFLSQEQLYPELKSNQDRAEMRQMISPDSLPIRKESKEEKAKRLAKEDVDKSHVRDILFDELQNYPELTQSDISKLYQFLSAFPELAKAERKQLKRTVENYRNIIQARREKNLSLFKDFAKGKFADSKLILENLEPFLNAFLESSMRYHKYGKGESSSTGIPIDVEDIRKRLLDAKSGVTNEWRGLTKEKVYPLINEMIRLTNLDSSFEAFNIKEAARGEGPFYYYNDPAFKERQIISKQERSALIEKRGNDFVNANTAQVNQRDIDSGLVVPPTKYGLTEFIQSLRELPGVDETTMIESPLASEERPFQQKTFPIMESGRVQSFFWQNDVDALLEIAEANGSLVAVANQFYPSLSEEILDSDGISTGRTKAVDKLLSDLKKLRDDYREAKDDAKTDLRRRIEKPLNMLRVESMKIQLKNNALLRKEFSKNKEGVGVNNFFENLAEDFKITGWSAADMFNAFERSGYSLPTLMNLINKQAEVNHQLQAQKRLIEAKAAIDMKAEDAPAKIRSFITEGMTEAEKKDYESFVGGKRGQSEEAMLSAYRNIELNLLGQAEVTKEKRTEEAAVKSAKKKIYGPVVEQLTKEQRAEYDSLTDEINKLDSIIASEPSDVIDPKVSDAIEKTRELEAKREAILMANARPSVATLTAIANATPHVSTYFETRADLTAYEQELSREVQVGKLNDPAAQSFYYDFAKLFNADLVIVSDSNYKTQYIPKASDGRAKIVINVAKGVPVGKLFSHEVFHHIWNKANDAQKEAFKKAIRETIGDSAYESLVARFEGGTKAVSEEEMFAEMFTRVFTQKEFYEELAKTHNGKTIAAKIIDGLVRLVGQFYKLVTFGRKSHWMYETDVLVNKDDIAQISYIFADFVGFVDPKGDVSSNEIRYYTPIGKATEKEVNSIVAKQETWGQGFWKKVFPHGAKGRINIMNGVENLLKEALLFIKRTKPAGLFASFMADPAQAAIANRLAHEANKAVAEANYAVVKKHAHAFKGMTPAQKEKLHDDIVRGGLDFSKEEDVAKAKELGYNEEIINTFKDYKKITDEIYEKLKAIYPNLPKLNAHYGQSIKWTRTNGIELDPSFDWAINPERSQLEGSKHWQKEMNLTDSTADIAKNNKLKYRTIDPHELFLEYVKDTNKLLVFKDAMTQATLTNGANGKPIVKTFTNQFLAAQEGYVPVDDNALKIMQEMDLPLGYKVAYTDAEGKNQYLNEGQVFATYEEALAAQQEATENERAFGSDLEFTVESVNAEIKPAIAYYQIKATIVDLESGQPIKTHILKQRNFNSKEDAEKFIIKLNEEKPADAKYVYGVHEVKAKAERAQVAQIYFQPDLARMVNVLLAKDNVRQFSMFGISGHNVMNLKNKQTSIEFALSGFHALTIMQELTASYAPWAWKTGRKGKIPMLNLARGVGESRDLTILVQSVMADPSLANNEAVVKKAKELLSVEDLDVLDLVSQFYKVGGLLHEDTSLRSTAHKKGHASYTGVEERMVVEGGEVKFVKGSIGDAIFKDGKIAPGFRKTFSDAIEDNIKENGDSRLKGYLDTAEFGALQYTTAWLMEYMIPRMKMASFMREYTLKLSKNKAKIDAGLVTKEQLADDTMAFIEDRFGEVNWQNMWLHPGIKTLLQFTFRSFTWFTGSWMALGKGGIDVAKWGWFKAKGERYEITEKGWWGLTAILSHVITVGMINMLYQGVMAAFDEEEVETPEDTPYITRALFPRWDPSDPQARMTVPSYVSEFYKILRHLGVIGHEKEYMKLFTGRVNSLLSSSYEALIAEEDWSGVAIGDPNDIWAKRVFDKAWHIAVVSPISVSSFMQNVERRGWGHSGRYLPIAMVGITDAPAAAKRSDAANLAFYFARQQNPEEARSEEEVEQSQELTRAMFAYGQGDKEPAQKLLAEGKISRRQFDNALTKLAMIDGKKNPLYKDPLSQGLRRLTVEKSLEVWDVMTENEMTTHKAEIRKKYYNMMARKDKSPQYKEKIKQMMRDRNLI